MSWSSTPIEPSDGAHIGEAIDAATIHGTGLDTPEHREQLAAVKASAKALIASGALGDAGDGRIFTVSMGGHANAGHQPRPGWANDAVYVNVQSNPADSDAVRYAREAYERYQAQQAEAAKANAGE